MRNRFWVWLAGFIDGDGCVYISKKRNKNRIGFQLTLRVEIAQSNKKVLEAIKSDIGFGSNIWNKQRSNKWKDAYALKFSSNQALEILEKIYPYLRVKKEQVKYAIKFQRLVKNNMGNGNRLLKSYWEKQLFYRDKIKELKN